MLSTTLNDAFTSTNSAIATDLSMPSGEAFDVRYLAALLTVHPMLGHTSAGSFSTALHSLAVASELAFTHGPRAALYGLLHHADLVLGKTNSPHATVMALHDAFGLAWPAPRSIERAIAAAHMNCDQAERRYFRFQRQFGRSMMAPHDIAEQFEEALEVNLRAAALSGRYAIPAH